MFTNISSHKKESGGFTVGNVNT